MNKSTEFKLNKFSPIPNLLRATPSIDLPASGFSVDLSRLYHHYYTDSWGTAPPDPDHTNFEYLRFLSGCEDFRFFGSGPGASSGKKKTVSHETGQAFCRYFLYEFCRVTYFAHMDKVLNKKTHPAFNGLGVTRKVDGDVPDYLCARSVSEPYIAEAKGRFSSISFASSEFNEWRKQFSRINVLDRSGRPISLKGYIVATRFSTETRSSRIRTTVYAEDPFTDGEVADPNEVGLGLGCVALHYARLISKLGLHLLAASLENGFVVPSDLRFTLPVWRCLLPPFEHLEFVGGIASSELPKLTKTQGGYIYSPTVLLLRETCFPFFGLEHDTFSKLRQSALGDWAVLRQLRQIEDTDARYSDLALLRDGSISGRLEYFELVRFDEF